MVAVALAPDLLILEVVEVDEAGTAGHGISLAQES
jgi:hypothetical protein